MTSPVRTSWVVSAATLSTCRPSPYGSTRIRVSDTCPAAENNWRSLGGFFPAGAPVTATTRHAGNLDLFITGNDGRVYTSWWYEGKGWSGINNNWRRI